MRIKRSADDYATASMAARKAADNLAASWEGDAQRAFVREQAIAHAWYTEMAGLASAFAQALAVAADSYAQTDADAGHRIQADS